MHNLGMCKWHARAKAAKALVLKISLGSCDTDGPFKVKGSLLWVAYSSLDSQSLTTAFKMSISRQQCIDSKVYRIVLEDNIALDLR